MIYRRLDSWLFDSSEAGVGERAAIGDCGQVTLEAINASELRPETWTRLMVAVMRLVGGPDLGILLGSGP